MSLAPGTRIGSYEVITAIGAGGMGEVYRARDTALNRDVAIKVLLDAVASDPERVARFQREAEALAALNHPNIAHIYGLEKSTQAPAIVMELVEGPTLADRLDTGALSLDESLAIAKQMAEGLEAAHERNILHRDLKPANVKVRDDGTVKLLDFGLAKALLPDTGAVSGELANSPTLTARATQLGVILGTAAYMAPEQAKGKVVDRRADVWAFGVVLFEMLTGKRPFDGSDVTEVMARVIDREPDWSTLPANTPPLMRRLLQRCLTKDVKQRLHDIADARFEIEETLASRARGEVAGQAVVTQLAPRVSRWLAPALALAGTAAGLGFGFLMFKGGPTEAEVMFLALSTAPAEEMSTSNAPREQLIAGGARTGLAWSPDGRSLAFIGHLQGSRKIFVRDLSKPLAVPLEGTENATNLTYSYDGNWIAFVASGEVRKIRIDGGPAAKICAISGAVNGISWGPTRIVFAGPSQLFEVSSEGGQQRAITTPNAGTRHASPHLLPGDNAVLFTEHDKDWTSGDERVMVLPLGPLGAPLVTPTKLLAEAAADARYLPTGPETGHLAFLQQGTLFAVPFDPTALALNGTQMPVQPRVAQAVIATSNLDLTLAGQFAISSQGNLAFVSSPLASIPEGKIGTVDLQGGISTLKAPANSYYSLSVSKDGLIAVQLRKTFSFSIFDIRRENLSPINTRIPWEALSPKWSRDGRLAACVSQGGVLRAAVFRPDSAVPPDILPESDNFWPNAWSPDDRHLIGRKDNDVWVFPVGDPTAKPKAFFETPETESHPSWSPDGKSVVYVGRGNQVWVRPYPGPEPATQISDKGGRHPLWNPDPARRELFYVEPPAAGSPDDKPKMMSVDMTKPNLPGKPIFRFNVPKEMSYGSTPSSAYVLSADGRRFYTALRAPQESLPVTHVTVIFNWFEVVKRQLGTTR